MLVLSIFKDIDLALARVSIFCVPDVIVNGPNEELACESFGKSLKFSVTQVSPVCAKKSRMTLLIFIINSPSPANPCWPISKSPDSMFAVIADV